MVKFNTGLNRVLSVVTAVALIVMMLHVVAHAMMRHFFDAPIYGTNELVAYWYLPAVALLGIPAAQLRNEQITVSLLVDRMKPMSALIFKVFGCVLGSIIALGFAWFGLGEAMEKMEIRATAGVVDIVAWPVYFLVPIVFVLLAILYVIDMVMSIRARAPEVDLVAGTTAEHETEEDSAL